MKGLTVFLSTIFVLLLVSNAIGKEVTKMSGLKMTSPVFENNGNIPKKYTCDGKDVNPPLLIENVPTNTKSLALIADDPDAPRGTWAHWVVWNIDPQTGAIKEDSVPKNAKQGMNDFRRRDYGGPCPPSGTHRYFFKLYALDTVLNIGQDSTKADLEKAMNGHILEEVSLTGLYKRK